jgi:MtaA/CmuA family methyltransferase
LILEDRSFSHLVFPINALPACRLVDQGIDEICWNVDVKYQAVSRYYQEVDADVLFFFSDIVIQAEAMGAGIQYSRDAMPGVVKVAQTIHEPETARVPRMNVNANVIRRLAQDFPRKLLSAMVYGPFTVAGQLVGEQNLLRAILDRPTDVLELLHKTLSVARRYAVTLLEAGAHVLWVSDPLAALIPPSCFRKFAGDFLSSLFAVQASGPTALHICGDTSLIVGEMIDTGVTGISFDQCMNLLAIEDSVPEDVFVIGNVDPVEILELSTEKDVASTTADLASVMGVRPNFALSSGCAPPPSAPISNIVAFVNAGRSTLAAMSPHRVTLGLLADAVWQGNREAVPELLVRGKAEGADPLMLVSSGLMRGVRKGSALYETKRSFLPDILLTVDAFYEGYKCLELDPRRTGERQVQLVLGTVKGDIHEIGKDIVKSILEANGIRVLDLGVNVPAERFAEAARSTGAQIVGLSVFVTSSRKEVATVVHLLKDSGRKSVMTLIGGAAASQTVSDLVGADGYAPDAIRAVRLVENLMKKQASATRAMDDAASATSR